MLQRRRWDMLRQVFGSNILFEMSNHLSDQKVRVVSTEDTEVEAEGNMFLSAGKELFMEDEHDVQRWSLFELIADDRTLIDTGTGQFGLKFDNGMLFIWGSSVDSAITSNAQGTGFRSGPIITTFTAGGGFVAENPVLVSDVYRDSPAADFPPISTFENASRSTSQFSCRIQGAINSSGGKVGYFAIGRWK